MQDPTLQDLADFIAASPTPFHATATLRARLLAAGFTALDERSDWQLEAGGRYLVTRNDSSLIAFQLGAEGALGKRGLRLIGAHTDSPCLRVKPQPEKDQQGLWQLGVEIYGGALLAPWFDRDLSLAGRVTFRNVDGALDSRLIDFQRPVAVVPNLAIHLNRGVNDGLAINPQTDMPPILAHSLDGGRDLRALLASQLASEHPDCEGAQVLDYELSFYDTQRPAQLGLDGDFFSAARLDNLLSCHAGLNALLDSDGEQPCLLVCTDHEEIGSSSCCGADGPFLEDVLRRLISDDAERIQVIQRSLLVSADNAHAVHPNFAMKHDENHGPKLNAGPVIKINNNQRYATNSETAAYFRDLCARAEVPVQTFVVRSDMGCGSTIGPITASRLGVRTVDIGAPTFAMHSIRELAGSRDPGYLISVLTAFCNSAQLI
ncbi:MAG TPA: M18 family aminopeptidase [Pseudomonas sp.]|nr:M18 family aminopeptidase [Pseudomonadales bacterium]MEB3736452.1 M18 family aminopeptidase [Halopseudomonas pachastrellae]MED5491157.1 M18 family aminopeptidase [Pseudomonadota bacterium]HCB43540.1 M18 family aminopeptidase [Pseudomonas sp.]HCL40214.1 M18 family aminopeptidase [Pseudomonas sp.]|tara:strand:+ start:1617 stop:2912 length:1296 start_codon:yes stop_codon:yes gene_type:complete